MAEKLVLKDDSLKRGLASLRAAKADFDLVQDRAQDAADACGHDELRVVLKESSSTWALRRGKLSEALESLAGHMKNAIDGFEHWEITNTQGLQDSQGASGEGAISATSTTTPSGGGNGAGNTGPSAPSEAGPPAASSAGNGSLAAGPAADGPAAFAAPDPLQGSQATSQPERVSTAGQLGEPGAFGGGDSPVAEVPAATLGSSANSSLADGNPRLKDAGLEQLVRALSARWLSLGGTEQGIIAALTGAGLVGVAAGASRTATSGSQKSQEMAGGAPDDRPHSRSGPHGSASESASATAEGAGGARQGGDAAGEGITGPESVGDQETRGGPLGDGATPFGSDGAAEAAPESVPPRRTEGASPPEELAPSAAGDDGLAAPRGVAQELPELGVEAASPGEASTALPSLPALKTHTAPDAAPEQARVAHPPDLPPLQGDARDSASTAAALPLGALGMARFGGGATSASAGPGAAPPPLGADAPGRAGSEHQVSRGHDAAAEARVILDDLGLDTPRAEVR